MFCCLWCGVLVFVCGDWFVGVLGVFFLGGGFGGLFWFWPVASPMRSRMKIQAWGDLVAKTFCGRGNNPDRGGRGARESVS